MKNLMLVRCLGNSSTPLLQPTVRYYGVPAELLTDPALGHSWEKGEKGLVEESVGLELIRMELFSAHPFALVGATSAPADGKTEIGITIVAHDGRGNRLAAADVKAMTRLGTGQIRKTDEPHVFTLVMTAPPKSKAGEDEVTIMVTGETLPPVKLLFVAPEAEAKKPADPEPTT